MSSGMVLCVWVCVCVCMQCVCVCVCVCVAVGVISKQMVVTPMQYICAQFLTLALCYESPGNERKCCMLLFIASLSPRYLKKVLSFPFFFVTSTCLYVYIPPPPPPPQKNTPTRTNDKKQQQNCSSKHLNTQVTCAPKHFSTNVQCLQRMNKYSWFFIAQTDIYACTHNVIFALMSTNVHVHSTLT